MDIAQRPAVVAIGGTALFGNGGPAAIDEGFAEGLVEQLRELVSADGPSCSPMATVLKSASSSGTTGIDRIAVKLRRPDEQRLDVRMHYEARPHLSDGQFTAAAWGQDGGGPALWAAAKC
jgi:hypothetical protein